MRTQGIAPPVTEVSPVETDECSEVAEIVCRSGHPAANVKALGQRPAPNYLIQKVKFLVQILQVISRSRRTLRLCNSETPAFSALFLQGLSLFSLSHFLRGF